MKNKPIPKVYKSQEEILSLHWKKNPKPLRGRPGVYRIVEKLTGAILYIGQASYLGNRLSKSVHPVFNREFHDVYIIFENDRNERRRMEWSFIQLLKPKLNKKNGLAPADGIQEFADEQYKRIFPY
jgi:hypothetical protein